MTTEESTSSDHTSSGPAGPLKVEVDRLARGTRRRRRNLDTLSSSSPSKRAQLWTPISSK